MTTLAMLAVTSNLQDPMDRSAISVTGMRTMNGTMRGVQSGEASIEFMKQFDYVVVWHWIPKWLVRDLQETGTEVIQALNIQAVPTYPEWHPNNEALRQCFVGPANSLLRGNGYNRFGHPYLDIYETSDGYWNEKPHAWAVNVNHSLGLELFTHTLTDILEEYEVGSAASMPRGFFIDSMHDHYLANCSNGSEVPRGIDWDKYTSMISGLFAPVWGHSGSWSPVGTFKGWKNVDEWGLRDKPVTRILRDIWDAHEAGQVLCLAPNNGPSDMEKLQEVLAARPAEFIVQAARSGMWALDSVEF